MINANIDKTGLLNEIVNPIRDGFAGSLGGKIIDIHTGIFAFCLPFPPIILEIPKQFSLFAINRDRRIPLVFELLGHLIDMLKLIVAVGMLLSFDGSLVGLERKMMFVQSFCQGRLLDTVSLGLEGLDQMR